LKSNPPDDLGASHDVPGDVQSELARQRPRLGSFGRRLHWLQRATSTNDIAAHLAGLGAEEGTTVVAESQTSGRGRMGRVWFSPPGAGLYVSTVLRPREGPSGSDPSALLTIAAGVAVAEGIQAATGLAAEIKWPNDLVVHRRKLAGILAEAASQRGSLAFIVLGFGVNLRPAGYPPDIADRATSIEAEIDRPADRALIIGEILAALAARYADLQEQRFDAILSAWRRKAPSLRDALVEWESHRGVQRGRAQDIDVNGALLVRVEGRMERVIAGEVRWI
jgi:BirA family biotin operon repressor/biotin-[acetyl-CoA-carboxylase] ligase